MTLLAVGVAGYALTALLLPGLRTSFIENLYATLPAAIAFHLGGGAVALIAGALQLNSRLRKNYPPVHRWLGRVYVIAVLAGGVAGLTLALDSFGGIVTHFGFGMLAVLWLASTAIAWRHIRDGNVRAHRAWMIRSYALTLAAVTLRIYLPLSQVSGIPFEDAYPAISWMCWVPNIIVAEWLILNRKPGPA